MSQPPAPVQPVTCLVTGATGYVGGRLVPELLAAGYRVRCMARRAARLSGFPWIGQVEVAEADALDPGSLHRVLTGVDVAYYLIHALGSGPAFEATDRAAAETFAASARAAGVSRIIYLGGLRPPGEALSPHLRSRAEVGDILLRSGVPTAVLRAGVIIGSGSASFEMLRYLTERLPVMVTPKWVRSRTQPIAIQDVLYTLAECARLRSPRVPGPGADQRGAAPSSGPGRVRRPLQAASPVPGDAAGPARRASGPARSGRQRSGSAPGPARRPDPRICPARVG